MKEYHVIETAKKTYLYFQQVSNTEVEVYETPEPVGGDCFSDKTDAEEQKRNLEEGHEHWDYIFVKKDWFPLDVRTLEVRLK